MDLEAITSMELIDPEYFGLNDDSYLEPPVLSSQPVKHPWEEKTEDSQQRQPHEYQQPSQS